VIRRWYRLLLLAALGMIVSACTGATQVPSVRPSSSPDVPLTAAASVLPSPPVHDRHLVFTLLADNRLLVLRTSDGSVVAERRLAPDPASFSIDSTPGQYIARSTDGARVFVLLPPQHGSGTRVVVVDIATITVQGTYQLDESEGTFRGISVGSKSGNLYLFGSRVNGNTARSSTTGTPTPIHPTPPADAVVAVLDATNGAMRAKWIARESNGYDWRVYQGAVSDDERALYLSYHGPDTSGIDRFDITDHGLQRCREGSRPDLGCLPGHGGFTLYGDGLLVATGSGLILNIDTSGTIRSGFDTGLTGHLMEFAVDAKADRLYAVGACGYRGGFSAVGLRQGGTLEPPTVPGEWSWRATPVPPLIIQPALSDPCGARVALGPDNLLVAAKDAGTLFFLDRTSGQVLRSTDIPGGIDDILVSNE